MGLRTDLAVEACAARGELSGVIKRERERSGLKITEVEITTDESAAALERRRGRYITIESQAIANGDRAGEKALILALADEFRSLAKDKLSGGALIVGLGNSHVTADSLGPEVAAQVFVTRHIKSIAPEAIDARVNDVGAISPGVLGVTGVETFEIIEGVVQKIKPSIVVAIDSLCAREVSRIRTSFQLTDTGISPGSGLGGRNKALNEESLGIPVIALGVPLVVYASSIAEDLLAQVILPDTPEYDRLTRSVSETQGAELVVTPKDIDAIVEAAARVISDSLNVGLHNGITAEEAREYMS